MRRDAIAMVLAIGLAIALNLIVVAILYDAIHDPAQAGISENATQILTGWGGGIIGILGAVFGYQIGSNQQQQRLVAQEADSDADQPQGPADGWPTDSEH